MNKNYLSPYDCDMCAMIEDLTKTKISVAFDTDEIRISWEQKPIGEQSLPERQTNQAIKQAIKGRIGNRKHRFSYENGLQTVILAYDPKEYPEEIRTRLVVFDPKAGTRFCRTLKEINAIQVRRDNVDELLKFTGGGTMTTPRTPDGIAVYSFPNQNGIFIDVTETWYIIREDNGEFTTRSKRDFDAEFEPKGIRNVGNYDKAINPVIKEALELLDNADDLERCENCETRLPYEQMLHDREGVPLCPECMEALKGDPNFEMVGVIKIKEERESQIYEHGFDVSHDRKNNKYGEIKQAVAAILNNDLDLYARTGWDYKFYDHIKAKPELEQLAICGALVAAEIDRLTIKN